LHRVGKAYRVADPSDWQVEGNAKLVMMVDRPLAELRAELTAKGVSGRRGPIIKLPLHREERSNVRRRRLDLDHDRTPWRPFGRTQS
jgi:hypothetical protein